jgi:hypothetical protein
VSGGPQHVESSNATSLPPIEELLQRAGLDPTKMSPAFLQKSGSQFETNPGPSVIHPGGGAATSTSPSSHTPSPPSPFEIAANVFKPHRTFEKDPHGWITSKLAEFVWSQQQAIIRSVQDERYTAVQSCHDAGKSFIAARTAAWWIDAHPPGEAFVVSTAPTSAQVSAILWREIGKAHRKGNLLGSITTAGYPQWKINGNEIVGYGRKPADYSEAAFQGIHARFVLVIMDEACGIDKTLFDAVDALATNEYARVLAIGNPDDPTSHFASVCRPDSGWNVIRIDGLRTPNFTRDRIENLVCRQCRKVGRESTLLQDLYEAEGVAYSEEFIPDELRPMLLTPIWVEERLHRWVGRVEDKSKIGSMAAQSALFTSKVRGIFPTSNTEGAIPLGWVERAMDRYREWVSAGRRELVGRAYLGVDVARMGEDETCIAERVGTATHTITQYPKQDTMETTGYVSAKLRPIGVGGGRAVVDAIGVGAGVLDRLRELDLPAEGFTASGSAKGLHDKSGEFGFTTLRSAAWWNMRELLDPSRNSTVMLPDDEVLKADLTAPKWWVRSGGNIQVEPKDEVRKRLGRSTDKGDAVVMAYWPEIGAMDAPGEPRAIPWYDEDEQSQLTAVRWVSDHEGWDVNPDVTVGWDGLVWRR